MLCGLLWGTTVKVVRPSLCLSSSQPGGTMGSPSRDPDTGERFDAGGECVTDLKRDDDERAGSVKNKLAGELYN